MVSYLVTLFVLFMMMLIWIEYIMLRNYNIHKMIAPIHYGNPFLDSHIIPHATSLTQKSIVFTGLARNIETKIERTIENCVVIGTFFTSYKIVIFENDSSDDTRRIIQEMSCKNPNIMLVECEGYPDCKFQQCELYEYGIMNKNRIDRMAFFRNVCMNIVQTKFSSYEYVCVLDFDIDGSIPLSGFLHALDCPLEWSCICANGRSSVPGTFGMFTTMYDAMALCTTDEDFVESVEGSRGMYPLFKKYLKLMKLSNYEASDYVSGFVPIKSAFNGLAIYKMKDIQGLFYKKGYSCEHISLHEQLVKQNKKLFIDTYLIIYAGHQGPRQISQFFLN